MNKTPWILVSVFAATCLAGELGEPQIKPAEGAVLVPWDQAGEFAGRRAVVYGKVVAAKTTEWQCYLNFHQDYRKYFSVSISKSAFDNFPKPPEKMYAGQRVAVFGYISGEGAAPHMYLRSPEQIRVAPEDEEDLLYFAASNFPEARTPDDLQGLRKPRTAVGTIRIGSYNVLNFFDEFDDPYRADEVMEVKPREALRRVAERIRKLDADVLCLQEVENRFFLERFVQAFLPDMGYDHVVLLEANNQRGIDCAVVSRFPVGPVTTYQYLTLEGADGKTYGFQRDFLQVRIEGPEEFALDVFCVHLKSKYGGAEESEPVRKAEAAKIRQICDRILADRPAARFVICGDFNDYWDSASLQLIRGSGDTELVCPGVKELEESKRITYNKKPYRSMIDFIVCSPEMHRRYVEDSYTVISGTVDSSGSDHNPSVAAFSIE